MLIYSAVKIGDEAGLFIPTLNNTGYALSYLDEFSKDFLRYASKNDKPVLKIGSAYGLVALEALSKGVNIYCSDIEQSHLKFIEQSATVNRHLLTLVKSAFPYEVALPNDFSVYFSV